MDDGCSANLLVVGLPDVTSDDSCIHSDIEYMLMTEQVAPLAVGQERTVLCSRKLTFRALPVVVISLVTPYIIIISDIQSKVKHFIQNFRKNLLPILPFYRICGQLQCPLVLRRDQRTFYSKVFESILMLGIFPLYRLRRLG